MLKVASLLLTLGLLGSAQVGSSGMCGGSSLMPVSGSMTYAVVDPGRQWVDSAGILHIRDSLMTWNFPTGSGDLVGSGWGVFSANINPVTGDGDTQGFHYLTLAAGQTSGTFWGHASGTITGGIMNAEFNAPHGGGGFAGMKMRTDIAFTWGSGVGTYSGVIHDPKGQ
jgi:hypothetical protein